MWLNVCSPLVCSCTRSPHYNTRVLKNCLDKKSQALYVFSSYVPKFSVLLWARYYFLLKFLDAYFVHFCVCSVVDVYVRPSLVQTVVHEYVEDAATGDGSGH